MAVEIERKFLVKSELSLSEHPSEHIAQGYLSVDPKRTVRIRVVMPQLGSPGEHRAFLTVKGLSTDDGLSRAEWEYPIPIEDAREMLAISTEYIVKDRYKISVDGFTFEVDQFSGENTGLIVAEIELSSSDQEFPRPSWLGEEVTGDPKYYNSQLGKNPYTTW